MQIQAYPHLRPQPDKIYRKPQREQFEQHADVFTSERESMVRQGGRQGFLKTGAVVAVVVLPLATLVGRAYGLPLETACLAGGLGALGTGVVAGGLASIVAADKAGQTYDSQNSRPVLEYLPYEAYAGPYNELLKPIQLRY